MSKLASGEQLRLLSKVSKLYYEQGLTQDEIVKKLQLSRPKVSRLLKQARDEGVVKITVISPPSILSDLETEIESRFRLEEAVIIEARERDSPETMIRELGAAAASYLCRAIRDKDKIGISWGSTLQSMVDAMQPCRVPAAQVVQMIGGLGYPEGEVHAADLCRRLSKLLGCKLALLHAPGVVDSKRVKHALLSDSHVSGVFDLFPRLSMAVVGIGAPTPDSVVMRSGSIITQAELQGLLTKGAVGDIALRFFDAYGEPVASDLDDRVIGISVDQLKKVERVIGVAGGPQKIEAVRGALCGHLVNVLITDQITALQLLELDSRRAA